jgi:hypothetical protein
MYLMARWDKHCSAGCALHLQPCQLKIVCRCHLRRAGTDCTALMWAPNMPSQASLSAASQAA